MVLEMNGDDPAPEAIEQPLPGQRMSAEAVSEMLARRRAASEELRERAVQLAARTDRPSYPRVIGAVIMTGAQPDLAHPVFADALEGAKERAVAGRYDLLLFSGHAGADYTAELSYVERCRRHNVDGVILMGFARTDPELEHLLNEQIPTVAIDLDLVGAKAGYVMSDNIEASATAVQYLHSLGYERIAHITGILDSRPGTDRALGYRSGLERDDLGFRPENVVEGNFSEQSGYDGMQRLLALVPPPEAVFCASDMEALGAIRAVHDAGGEVPGDMAVIGFDDAAFAAAMDPGLTTIRQDKTGLGAAACEALIRIIEGTVDEPPVVVLSVELVIRESCGAALRFKQGDS